jgi:hypothetical protein
LTAYLKRSINFIRNTGVYMNTEINKGIPKGLLTLGFAAVAAIGAGLALQHFLPEPIPFVQNICRGFAGVVAMGTLGLALWDGRQDRVSAARGEAMRLRFEASNKEWEALKADPVFQRMMEQSRAPRGPSGPA